MDGDGGNYDKSVQYRDDVYSGAMVRHRFWNSILRKAIRTLVAFNTRYEQQETWRGSIQMNIRVVKPGMNGSHDSSVFYVRETIEPQEVKANMADIAPTRSIFLESRYHLTWKGVCCVFYRLLGASQR